MLTDDGPDGCDTAAWIAAAAVVQRQDRHDRHLVRRRHAARPGHGRLPAAGDGRFPVDAMSNLGYASMRNGGAFELRFWNWIMLNAGRGSRAVARSGHRAPCSQEMADHRLDYLPNLPLRRGTTPLKLAPEYEDWLVEAMRHGGNDDFWRQNNILDHADQLQGHARLPRRRLVRLVGRQHHGQLRGAQPKAIKGPVYLIMGPWIHGQQGKSRARPGRASAPTRPSPIRWPGDCEWYDHWLKGIDNSGRARPPRSPRRCGSS